MNRRHIPVHEVAPGARVFVVPRDESTPRGPGLDPIPREGMELQVNDYIHGAIQRGALVAYGLELSEPAPAPAPAERSDAAPPITAPPAEDSEEKEVA